MRSLALASVSTLLGVLLAEAVMRVAFDPIDYLEPVRAPHPVLTYTIVPHSAGHDAWGFRNRSLPERARLVAIGDSQTYGVMARSEEAWPAQLAASLGEPVYSLALGGYGPPDYLYLLETRAFSLSPEVVIVGLYLGNDFFDTRRSVYTHEHWRDYRKPVADPVETPLAPTGPAEEAPTGAVRGVGHWLRNHSLFFRLIEDSALGQTLLGSRLPAGVCTLRSRAPHDTAFLPANRLRGVSTTYPDVREGVDLAITLLLEMADAVRHLGARLLVVLIPTKESVFAAHFDPAGDARCLEAARSVVRADRDNRERVTRALAAAGIEWVDALPVLREAARSLAIYPSTADGHPLEAGYAAIAAALAPHVRQP